MQSLTNSRTRPGLLDRSLVSSFPEMAPAAKALASAMTMPGVGCCGSSREQKEVDALALALQIAATMDEPRLISFLRRLGFRGPVKVYRRAGSRKERAVVDCGA